MYTLHPSIIRTSIRTASQYWTLVLQSSHMRTSKASHSLKCRVSFSVPSSFMRKEVSTYLKRRLGSEGIELGWGLNRSSNRYPATQQPKQTQTSKPANTQTSKSANQQTSTATQQNTSKRIPGYPLASSRPPRRHPNRRSTPQSDRSR